MNKKEQLYEFCKNYVQSRLARIKNNIAGVQDSLTSETKSSAGDKHETGRAMLQLEREKLGHQLAEAEKMAAILSRIPLAKPAETIILGSWVKTSKADYFLALSAGEYVLGGISVFCISAAAPIGQLIMGKSKGDTFNFNGESIKILEIN